MEDLFREILAASPTLPTSSLPPVDAASPEAAATSAPQVRLSLDENMGLGVVTDGLPIVEQAIAMESDLAVHWDNEADVQRLLDLLPSANSLLASDGFSSLDLSWELTDLSHPSASLVGVVGAF